MDKADDLVRVSLVISEKVVTMRESVCVNPRSCLDCLIAYH